MTGPGGVHRARISEVGREAGTPLGGRQRSQEVWATPLRGLLGTIPAVFLALMGACCG